MPTILLVEDQQVFRENLSEALEDHGYVVLQAEDARDATDLLDRNAVDLLLLDVALPGGSNGVELLASLRARAGLRRVPAFFLTAYPRPEILEAASRLGVGDFLVKSDISLQDLLERVERALVGSPSETPQSAGSMTESVIARRHLRPALRRWRPQIDRPQVRELFALTQFEPTSDRLASHLAFDTQGAKWLAKTFGDDIWRESPEDAIRFMVTRAVTSGAMPSVQSSPDLRRIWRKAIATAVLAERFAPHGSFATPLQAYLAGLCVEVPWVFAVQALETDYLEVRTEAWEEGRDISQQLAGAFATDPATLALETLRGLELPDSVWKAVVDVHGNPDAGAIWVPGPGGRVLAVVSELASIFEPYWHPCQTVRGIERTETSWLTAMLPLVDHFPAVAESLRLIESCDAFPEAGTVDSARVFQVEGESRRFAYFRAPLSLEPDPLEHALKQMGEVAVSDRPEILLEREDAIRVAWVEPGTSSWDRLMQIPRRTVILHKAHLPRKSMLGAHVAHRMPVPLSVLEKILRSR